MDDFEETPTCMVPCFDIPSPSLATAGGSFFAFQDLHFSKPGEHDTAIVLWVTTSPSYASGYSPP